MSSFFLDYYTQISRTLRVTEDITKKCLVRYKQGFEVKLSDNSINEIIKAIKQDLKDENSVIGPETSHIIAKNVDGKDRTTIIENCYLLDEWFIEAGVRDQLLSIDRNKYGIDFDMKKMISSRCLF